MADHPNIGDVLGAYLRLFDLKRREADYETNADGSTFAQDLITAAYNLSEPAQAAGQSRTNDHFERAQGPALASNHSAFRSIAQAVLSAYLDTELTLDDDDRATPIGYQYDQGALAVGIATIVRRVGFLGVLRGQMEADAETVLENTVTFGALTEFGTGTTGKLVAGSLVGADHTLSGTFKFTVISDIVEAPRLSVTLELDEPLIDGTTAISADNPIQVGKPYEDGPTGLSALLNLDAPVITGDTGGLFSVLTIVDPTEATSDKGAYHIKVTRLTGDVWQVEVFSDLALTVFQGSNSSASGVVGSTAITISLTVGSVGVTIDKAAAAVEMPLVGDTYTGVIFNSRIPRSGDIWTATASNDEASNFATKLAKVPGFRTELASGVAATAAYAEAKATDITLP